MPDKQGEKIPVPDYTSLQYTHGRERLQRQYDETQRAVSEGTATKLDLRRKQREIDTFLLSHDSTGALKGDKLGAMLSEQVEGKIASLDEHGHIPETQADKNSYLGMVTVSELTRINAEGGHTAGNQAMAKTVETIESAIHKVIYSEQSAYKLRSNIQNLYTIYHTRGGDFAFTLNFPDDFQDEIGYISGEIFDAIRWSRTDKVGESEGSDFGVTMVRRSDAIKMFNHLQDRLAEQKLPQLTDTAAKRALVEIWKKSNEIELEEQFISLKADKYIQMLEEGVDPQKTNEFFQKYVQKFFDGTAMASEQAFQLQGDTAMERRYASRDVHKRMSEAVKFKVARDLSRQRFGRELGEQLLIDVVADRELPEEQYDLDDEDKAILARQKETEIPVQQLVDRVPETQGGQMLAKYEAAITEGHRILNKLNKDLKTLSDEDIATLTTIVHYHELIPPKYGVDYSGQVKEDTADLGPVLERVIAGNGTPADVRELRSLVFAASQEFHFHRERFDMLTGLPNRGEYYDQLERMLSENEALGPGESVQTVFVDMGGLNYFNNGGREVGNYAIQKSAEYMEQALTMAGVEGRVFRYAGDEFTCLIRGTQDDVDTFRFMLSALKQNKPIPRTDVSSNLYQPQELVFDYGTSDQSLAEETMQVLAERELIDPAILAGKNADSENNEEYLNLLADIQTKIADAGIETTKARNRFIILMDKVRKTFPDGIPAKLNLEQQQLQLYIKYCQRALLSASMQELYDMANDESYDVETEQGKINLDAKIKEKKGKQEKVITTTEELEEEIVGSFVEEHALHGEIRQLEKQILVLQEEYDTAEARIQQLEQERQALLQVQEQHEKADRERRLAEIQGLLQLQQRHEEVVRSKREHKTSLEDQKAAVIQRRQGLHVASPTAPKPPDYSHI